MPASTPADPASLDGAATRGQTHRSSPVQTRIHNRDARARGRIISALIDAPSEDLCRAGDRIRQCCRSPLVLVSPSGDVDVSLCHCRHRMCPTCSRLRSIESARRVASLVSSMNSPRFVTLTLKATDAPLSDQIDRLLSCFRQLRRLVTWTGCVVGGVATIECTWNRATGTWHPHVHAIVDGRYLPQPALKAAWLKVTGDSFIVDVRKVNDARQAARYIAAYACKHGQVGSWPPDRIREYAAAMHGRRMVQTFGKSHGVKVDPAPDSERPPGLEPLATVREIGDLANEGHEEARLVVRWGWRLGGAFRVIWPGSNADKNHPLPPEVDQVRAALVGAATEVRRLSSTPSESPPRCPPPTPPPPRLYDDLPPEQTAQRYR